MPSGLVSTNISLDIAAEDGNPIVHSEHIT